MSDPYAPFPTIVYRCPGPHFGLPRTTYESIGVQDEQELAQRLGEGWFATLSEAAESFLNPTPVVEAVVGEIVTPDDSAPATREEMLAQAQLLGLRVDKRWSDETLLAKIDAAMAAAPATDDPI